MRPKEIVSYTMSRIRSKDTAPEIIVRKFLHSKGLRFRKNDKRFPGHPDIVLPKYNTIVLIHGCFWHMHNGNKCFKMPTTRQEYWQTKLLKNKQRDEETISALTNLGWKVIIVWECELKPMVMHNTLRQLFKDITNLNIG